MKLGLHLGYPGLAPTDPVALAQEAEGLGFDSVWAAELTGFDALTLLSWIGARTERIGLGTAIVQMAARTPTSLGMSIAGLDHLSEGRLTLGLGVSAPGVVEGWYGIPYDRPLAWTREYVAIARSVVERRRPLSYSGERYRIPYPNGHGATSSRLLNAPFRRHVPIFLAALGPKNVELAGEIADGWLPVFYSAYKPELFWDQLASGMRRSGRDPSTFTVAPIVMVAMGDDIDECRASLKPIVMFYVSARSGPRNFYQDHLHRLGYERAAKTIPDLYLDGKIEQAIDAVPDELIDEIALCGPVDRIERGIAAWDEAGAGLLLLATSQPEALRAIASRVLDVGAPAI